MKIKKQISPVSIEKIKSEINRQVKSELISLPVVSDWLNIFYELWIKRPRNLTQIIYKSPDERNKTILALLINIKLLDIFKQSEISNNNSTAQFMLSIRAINLDLFVAIESMRYIKKELKESLMQIEYEINQNGLNPDDEDYLCPPVCFPILDKNKNDKELLPFYLLSYRYYYLNKLIYINRLTEIFVCIKQLKML